MTQPKTEASSVSSSLTVIITTSPTPSAPSTELVGAILQSHGRHCPALTGCRIIVVLDNYDQVSSKARLKKGQVTTEQAEAFDLYKANVKKLILEQHYTSSTKDDIIFSRSEGEAEYGNPMISANAVPFIVTQTHDKKVTFIEPAKRLGFGLAVRSALRMTETSHVWINQHDWALEAYIPIGSILGVMKASESDATAPPVKYICLPAIRMLSYAMSADVIQFPVLKELTSQLKRDFVPVSQPEVKIPLTPLFFWHDKPHVASTAHYLARVFPSRLAMMRGDFIEDKIGQRARTQMKEGIWSKWACWLYYPDDGKQLCLRHLQGRTRLGAEAEVRKRALYRDQNGKDLPQENNYNGAA